MTDENSRLPAVPKPPEPMDIDKAYGILKAAIAGIPLVGSSVNELLSIVFAGPYQKRQEKWREEVAEVLAYLVNTKGVRLEDLQDNERFMSAVAYSVQIAMRNHETEKKEALRNALINTAISETIDESLQKLFLNYIDTFSVWHIKILKLFFSPQPPKQNSSYRSIASSLGEVLEETFPELRDKRDIYDQFWRDLYSKGLVGTDSLHSSMTAHGVYSKRTTEMGDKFLSFISSP